ncbi:MAG: aminotransferase class III-fold pyridoxal phosphate-dependent enzyme [Firmicutes bacterium]|jgi:4-aminobutyrate aminotransferase|nr:aminotransferase class III-fold pyridoxal phosphate-dependent enzyme [Bacillota bacterium]
MQHANSQKVIRKQLHFFIWYRFGDLWLIGALLGIELVKDLRTKEKAIDEAEKILYFCLEQGLSFKISQGNVLTLAPPLIITEQELHQAMDIVEAGIKKYCG